MTRTATRSRVTKETSIEIRLDLDGSGDTDVATGVPFFDHMLSQLGKHGGFDLVLKAQGDLDVDTHHTIEDVGIALGECLRDALGDKAGVRRFASITIPLDEALIDVALDLSGRPYLAYEVDPGTEPLGNPAFDPQLAEEFWRAFVTSAAITLHLRMLAGNNHHILEASFKGVARALRDAVRIEGAGVPSTKGQLVIAVLDYGIGNLRSATKALQRVGADALLTDDPALVRAAAAVVLPGVGAFGPCMAALRASGLEEPAREAIDAGVPFLGICIGMQMLYDGSEEDLDAKGMGVLPGLVRLLPDGVKRPQMQWNTLDHQPTEMLAGIADPAWVYFVHSYAPEPSPDVVATCDYGGPVVAAVQRGSLWATQFHPEKSGATGLRILANFVAASAQA